MAAEMGVTLEEVEGQGRLTGRVQPHAGSPRLPSGQHLPRNHRDADPRHHRGSSRTVKARRHRRSRRDHGSAGRLTTRSCSNQADVIDITAQPRCSRAQAGCSVPYKVGTMIEVPRAARRCKPDRRGSRLLLVRYQRPYADDLRFLARRRSPSSCRFYLEHGIIKTDPVRRFSTRNGVGQLVREAVFRRVAQPSPNSKCGICGEHGGEPSSVEFCHFAGLNYVSCSPFRVPIARLAAAHAALNQK